ncbi:hypothetical protein D3C87_1355110 [compost metagenome]
MEPNLLAVFSCLSNGVPVNATYAARGRAFFMRSCVSPPWLRWPSSTRTTRSAESLRHSGSLLAVLNLCTSVKVMRSVPLPMRLARSRPDSARLFSPSFCRPMTEPKAPLDMKFRRNWSSRSSRSVTTMKRHSCSALTSSSALVRNTMVKLLPEPVVCHTTPPSRPPSGRSLPKRASKARMPKNC